jgi:YHS domain-containing protein
VISTLMIAGGALRPSAARSPQADHPHESAHGGQIQSVGRHAHVEAVWVDGRIRVHVLESDAVRSRTIRATVLPAELIPADGGPGRSVSLRAQEPDAAGAASTFEAEMPSGIRGRFHLTVSVPIDGSTYRVRVELGTSAHAEMALPAPEAPEAERALFLSPGGAYTASDIEANGGSTPSIRFREFQAEHDLHPQKGDSLCPITKTRANPRCSWVIGGRTYLFCCPPCVTEFVKRAKKNPAELKLPSAYVFK